MRRLATLAGLTALALLQLTGCPSGPEGADEMAGSRMENEGVYGQWPGRPFPWRVRVPDAGEHLRAEPGGGWSIGYELEVDLAEWEERYGRFTHLVVGVHGEWRHDEQGWYRPGAVTFAVSSNFTSTGVPVERWDGWPRFRMLHGKEGSPFEGIEEFDLPGEPDGLAREHRFEGRLTVDLPPDTPVGWYEPRIFVLARVEGVPDPVHLGEYSYEWNDWAPVILPLVQVGAPEPPRLPWSILAEYPSGGRVGQLPREWEGKAELVGRSGFRSGLILPPGRYQITPSMPSLFPVDGMAYVDGGSDVISRTQGHFFELGNGEVRARAIGPDGEPQELGERRFARFDRRRRGPDGDDDDDDEGGPDRSLLPHLEAANQRPIEYTEDLEFPRPKLEGGPFELDMTRTGQWTVELTGRLGELFGREATGGGTYEVTIARPLSFSTSCKPGHSFLTGDGYPAKVNVNPPFPADVRVEVHYLPQSDPAREVIWTGSGTANKFGHFVPIGQEPLIFDEPGEYISHVEVSFVDARGDLWAGRQTSAGVVAPREQGDLVVHGTRSFPMVHWSFAGARERFADRGNVPNSFMPQTNLLQQDPYLPYHAEDTLFMPVTFSEENPVQPKFSFEMRDDALARELTAAYSRRSVAPIPWNQPPGERWAYLKDVVDLSTDSFAYFSTADGTTDELPIASTGRDGWNPFGFPQKRRYEAYVYSGVLRPGFPVLTSAYEIAPKGFYWNGSPNLFGYQFNRGLNGDSEGDVYRVTAGMVLKDLETGQRWYDAYASTVSNRNFDGAPAGVSILPPGERPIRAANGRDQYLFLASDTHDTLEVGETMGLGGVVMPVVSAEVTWKIRKPSGEIAWMHATGRRNGVVAGKPALPVDEPGIYLIEPVVKWGELEGDLPGLAQGSFWHCAVPRHNPDEGMLTTSVPGISTIDVIDGVKIPVTWPADLENSKLWFGVIMPGQVLDQGVLELDGSEWTYDFQPIQWAAQATNFDARDLGTGEWKLAETMVFQFFIEGERDGEKVYDALRLFLRRDRLYNYRALMSGPHGGSQP
jgi:hypothetical protein